MTYSSLEKAGGGVEQLRIGVDDKPDVLRQHQLSTNAADYRARAVSDGIVFKEHGLFPHDDPLLTELVGTPGLQPFEKHLPGASSPYESLPKGGWVTGDAAARNGLDLRLFYRDPAPSEQWGTVRGALRYGNGACIGNGFWTSVHGGAIESALDEATAELAKIAWKPMVSTVDITFKIRKAVPTHTSLLVECRVKEQKGIRLYVEGSIQPAEGGAPLATCEAVLADMTSFL